MKTLDRLRVRFAAFTNRALHPDTMIPPQFITNVVGEEAAREFFSLWYQFSREDWSPSRVAALMFCLGYMAREDEEEPEPEAAEQVTVWHVVQAGNEWQISDGPPGARGTSYDYSGNLEGALRSFLHDSDGSAELFRFHLENYGKEVDDGP